MKKVLLSLFIFFSLGIGGTFAWDINNYTFTEQHNIGTLNCDPIQLSYSHDGNFWSFLNYALRTGGCSGNTSYGKNLSTPWYINQISSSQNTYAGYSFSRVFDWFDNGDYYVRGRYYSGPGLQVHSCTTPYNSSTCTQIYSVAFTTTHLRGNIQNYYDASIYDNGNRLYIYVNGWIDEYSLSTPYDVSTLSLVRSYNIGGITGFKLTTDGSALFYNIGDTLYIYEISIPFDLTSTLTSLGNRVLLTGGNSFDIDDDGSHIIYSYKGDLTQADYVRGFENSDGGLSAGPPPFEVTNSGSWSIEAGKITHSNFETNFTGSIEYTIYQKGDFDNLIDFDDFVFTLSGTSQTFELESSIIQNNYNYEVQAWVYTGSMTGTDYFDVLLWEGSLESNVINEGTYTHTLTGFTLNDFQASYSGTIDFELRPEADYSNPVLFTGATFTSGAILDFVNSYTFGQDRYYITSEIHFNNNVDIVGPSATINYLNYSFSGADLTATGGTTIIDYGGKTDLLNLPCPVSSENDTTLEIPVFGFGTLTPFDTFSCFFSSTFETFKPIKGDFMKDNYNLESGENVLAGKYAIDGQTTQIDNKTFRLGDLFILFILSLIIINYLKANRQQNG